MLSLLFSGNKNFFILTLLQSSFPSYSRARRIGLCLNHHFDLQWPQATLWVLVALELLPSPSFTSLIGAMTPWAKGTCTSIVRTSTLYFNYTNIQLLLSSVSLGSSFCSKVLLRTFCVPSSWLKCEFRKGLDKVGAIISNTSHVFHERIHDNEFIQRLYWISMIVN